jgi:hypothetical protein
MNVNATRTDQPAPTYWNCSKKGYQEQDCRNPIKTNQKYKPVPEGKTARRTNAQEEPQIAIRTSRQVAIIQMGYNTSATQD